MLKRALKKFHALNKIQKLYDSVRLLQNDIQQRAIKEQQNQEIFAFQQAMKKKNKKNSQVAPVQSFQDLESESHSKIFRILNRKNLSEKEFQEQLHLKLIKFEKKKERRKKQNERENIQPRVTFDLFKSSSGGGASISNKNVERVESSPSLISLFRRVSSTATLTSEESEEQMARRQQARELWQKLRREIVINHQFREDLRSVQYVSLGDVIFTRLLKYLKKKIKTIPSRLYQRSLRMSFDTSRTRIASTSMPSTSHRERNGGISQVEFKKPGEPSFVGKKSTASDRRSQAEEIKNVKSNEDEIKTAVQSDDDFDFVILHPTSTVSRITAGSEQKFKSNNLQTDHYNSHVTNANLPVTFSFEVSRENGWITMKVTDVINKAKQGHRDNEIYFKIYSKPETNSKILKVTSYKTKNNMRLKSFQIMANQLQILRENGFFEKYKVQLFREKSIGNKLENSEKNKNTKSQQRKVLVKATK